MMASAERRSIGLINARVRDPQRPDTLFYYRLQSLTICAYCIGPSDGYLHVNLLTQHSPQTGTTLAGRRLSRVRQNNLFNQLSVMLEIT